MLYSYPDGVPPTTMIEISLLKGINHENIIKLLDVVIANKKLFLVFEYMDQNLEQVLELRKKDCGIGLPEHQIKVKFIFKEICYNNMLYRSNLC